MKAQILEFEGKTVEDAKASGLRELGLTEEQVTINVVRKGGLFGKAKVEIVVNHPEPSKTEVVEKTVRIPAKKEKPAAKPANDVSAMLDDLLEGADDKGAKAEGEAQEAKEPKRRRSMAELNAAIAKLEEVLAEIIPYLDLKPTFSSRIEEDEIIIDVATDEDPARLIGGRGDTIHALSEICRSIVNRDDGDYIRVSVDTADYRQRRADKIADMARREARKASKDRRTIELEPMNSYERRIVHAALANDKFVKTESAGEGRFRHVCIVPVQRSNNNYGDNRGNGGRDNRGGDRRDNRGGDRRDNRDGNRGGNRGNYGGGYANDNRRNDRPQAPKSDEPVIMNLSMNYETQPDWQQTKYDEPLTYGSNPNFKKSGPTKMRSFGKK